MTHNCSAYHLPELGAKVEVIVPLPLPVKATFKFPSDTALTPVLLYKGFKVQKLFVGVSFTESLTEKLYGVKLLPLPLESLPSVVAVVPELSSNNK